MAGKIFVSYRREDAAADARGIRDALADRFGPANVFMDVDNLLAGQRFDKKLSEALDSCDVLIAVMGRRWMDLLKARTTQSGEIDYVREEIAAALRRGIVVIPVRVGLEGRLPALPSRDDLPENLRDLILHQKQDVVHERFGRDMNDLVVAIDAALSPGYALSQQHAQAVPRWSQQPDPRGYDLASYMPAVLQGHAPAEPALQSAPDPRALQHRPEHDAAAHQHQRDPAHFGVPHQGYGETDADFDELLAEEEEPPRRGRGVLMIAAALVGAISLGGALAYTYKSFIAPSGGRGQLNETADHAPNKVKPDASDGKSLAHTDKTRLNRRPKDASPPIATGERQLPPPVATPSEMTRPGPQLVAVPGVMLDVTPQPQVRPSLSESTAVASAPQQGGYVAVLASKTSRMDALKAFADLQQKYGNVLSSRTPDVQEVNLGQHGIRYRAVVGPPGTRDLASGVCKELKTAGYSDCWVTAY
jgi:hypothetical protein